VDNNLHNNRFFTRSASLLFKIIPTGMVFPIFRGPLTGAKWIAGAAAGSAKGLSVIWNLAEAEQLNQGRKLITSESICFDIGANVGLYTLLFARYAKRVYAFEPLPRNIRFLVRTLELNSIRNATVVPCAVSDKTYLTAFKEGQNSATGCLDNTGYQPVTAVSLDDFVARINVIPSLMKIDVEGGEAQVLEGSKSLISSYKPIILLSTHGNDLRTTCLQILAGTYRTIIPLNAVTVATASEFAFVA
jgi:FkbM family methyltransferase